jgi:Domain of unknown function (DUF4845)
MKRPLKSGQRGISFLGLLFFGGIIAFLSIILAQAAPTYLEYFAVQKAVNKASAGGTVIEIRNAFDRAAAIDDITSITGKDLEVGKEGDVVVVSFSYTREIHIGGPAYLLLKYSGRSKTKSRG